LAVVSARPMWAEMSGVGRRAKSSLCCVAACAAFALAGSANADPGALAVAYQVNVAHSGVQIDAALTRHSAFAGELVCPRRFPTR
jgi:hypothetical protein